MTFLLFGSVPLSGELQGLEKIVGTFVFSDVFHVTCFYRDELKYSKVVTKDMSASTFHWGIF